MSRSTYSTSTSEASGAMVTLWIVLVVAILWFKIWLFGSLATSAIKSVSDNCDKQYSIEGVLFISGDWFCPSKE